MSKKKKIFFSVSNFFSYIYLNNKTDLSLLKKYIKLKKNYINLITSNLKKKKQKNKLFLKKPLNLKKLVSKLNLFFSLNSKKVKRDVKIKQLGINKNRLKLKLKNTVGFFENKNLKKKYKKIIKLIKRKKKVYIKTKKLKKKNLKKKLKISLFKKRGKAKKKIKIKKFNKKLNLTTQEKKKRMEKKKKYVSYLRL